MAMTYSWKKDLAVLALGGWLGAAASGEELSAPPPPLPAPIVTAPDSPPVAGIPNAPATADAPGSASAVDGHGWKGDYYGGAEAGGPFVNVEWLFWRRDVPRRFLGQIDINNDFALNDVTDIPIDSRQVHFNYKSGIRVQAGYMGDDGLGVDTSVMAFERWSNSTTVTSTTPPPGVAGNILSPFLLSPPSPDVFPFDFAESYGLSYTSRLYGGEINGRCNVAGGIGGISLLAGFRYLHIGEDFSLTAVGTATGAVPAPLITAQYAAKTLNNLYGAQIGAEAFVNLAPGLRVELSTKSGIFDNFAHQRSVITNAFLPNGAPFTPAGNASVDRVASVVEFGAFLHWWVTPNINVHVGYEGLLVTDVALAPKQLQFNTAVGAQDLIDTSGKVFYYGPVAGLEARW
jgi:hypothetical protein